MDDHNYGADNINEQQILENRDDRNDTIGLVGMILGIIALVLSFCCVYVSIPLGIAALICGLVAHSKNQRYAVAGIVMGIVSIALSIIFLIVGIIFYDEIYEEFFREFLDE